MNSLAYLSRQFDAMASFASAKTPSSTPSTEHPSFISDLRTNDAAPDTPLQRVNTWSTKSILFPPYSSSTRSGPKRLSSTSAFASLQRLVAPSGSSSSPAPEAQPLSKPRIENLVRRILFIRVFVLVWDNLRTAWSSLFRTEKLAIQPFPIAAEKQPEVEKGKSDDASDSSTHPTTSSGSFPSPVRPFISRAEVDMEFFDAKAERQQSATDSFPLSSGPTVILHASDTPMTTSRSSTPALATRKTPFHLPKTLVLDLDETLIHSTSRPMTYSGNSSSGLFGLGSFDYMNKGVSHTVEVVLGGRSTLYHVYKRPFVDFFLRTVSWPLQPQRLFY